MRAIYEFHFNLQLVQLHYQQCHCCVPPKLMWKESPTRSCVADDWTTTATRMKILLG